VLHNDKEHVMSTRTLTLSAAAAVVAAVAASLALSAYDEPGPSAPASPPDVAALVDQRHVDTAQHQLAHAAELHPVATPVAARPAPSVASGSRFTLLSIPGEEVALVDTGEPGDSVGDHSAFTDTLRSRAGRDVGTSSGTCTRTSVERHQSLCHATLVLDRGTLTVTGVVPDGTGSFVGAVTGGTGTYDGAAGTMVGVPQQDDSLRLEFSLTGR
jgi:hypothetical protein